MNRSFKLAAVLKKCGTMTEEELKKSRSSDNVTSIVFTIIGTVLLFWVGKLMADFGAMIADPVQLISLLFMCGALVGVFISIPSILNQFYMSNDLTVLITMPYKPTEILIARIINCAKTPVLIAFVFTIPAAVSYTIFAQPGPMIIVAAVLAWISAAIISFAFISFVLIIIMSIVKQLRNKDILKYIGVILLFVVFMAYMVLTNAKPTDAKAIINGAAALAQYSYIFPVNFALIELMHGFSVVAILEIIGITAAFAIVSYLTASKLYITGALAMQETGSAGGQLDAAGLGKATRRSNIVSSFTRKELKSIIREPAYLMMGFLYTFGIPIAIVVMSFMTGSMASSIAEDFKEAGGAEAFVLAMSICITLCAASVNAIACTPISREGAALEILRQMPVNYKDVIKAKQRAALIVCGVASVGYVIVGGIVCCFVFGMKPYLILLGLAVSIPLLFIAVDFNMIHDFKKPYLAWDTEAVMLKKTVSIGSYILLIIGCLSMALYALILYALLVFDYLLIPILAAVVVVFIVLAIVLNKRLYSLGVAAFENTGLK